MNILHCITSLDTGGAEKTLVNLVNRSKYKHLILTIKNSHKLKKFLNDEVKVINILPISIIRIIRLYIDIKKFDPNIIQGWMYHGDFIASFIGLIFFKPIFWNIRHGKMSFLHTSKKTFILRFILSIISYLLPKKIISCSNYGAYIHKKIGYCKKKFCVIHNGIFLESGVLKNYDNLKNRKVIRIASIGRDSPQKNRKYFFKILDSISKYRKVEGIIIGRGVPDSKVFRKIKNEKNYSVLLKDSTSDIKKAFENIDILLLTSVYGEGCPNIIIEAMKSSLLVISTDVGDSKYLINNERLIIPKNNSLNSSLKILDILNSEDLKKVVNSCKKRADFLFDENKMVKNYENLWSKVVFQDNIKNL